MKPAYFDLTVHDVGEPGGLRFGMIQADPAAA